MAARAFSTGRVHAAETEIIWLPPGWQGNHTEPAVIVVHGVGTSPATYEPPAFRRDLDMLCGPDGLTGMNGAGMAVVLCELGGTNLWPTDPVLARITEAIAFAVNTLGAQSDRIFLAGDSAGGATALIYMIDHLDVVRACSARLPAVALDAMHTRDPAGLGTFMDQAFVAAGTTWAASRATKDPSAAGPAAAISRFRSRVRVYWSTNDTTVLPADIAGFVALTGVEAVSVGAVGHSISGFSTFIAQAQARWFLDQL